MKKIGWFHILVVHVIIVTAAIFINREASPNVYYEYLFIFPAIIIACIICYFVYRKQLREEAESERLIKENEEKYNKMVREREEREENRIVHLPDIPKASAWNMALKVETVYTPPQPRSASTYSATSSREDIERLEELEEEVEELREQLEIEEAEELARLQDEEDERRRQEEEEKEEERKRQEEEQQRQEEEAYDEDFYHEFIAKDMW